MKKNISKKKLHFINDEIKCHEVRLPDVGIVTLAEALRMSSESGNDLVLLVPNANPPVCKIMNYQKFIYEESKKVKVKTLELKEIKIGPNTSENDLSYRIKQISKFLEKGHKVKITMEFKGRQMAHVDHGEALMLNLLMALKDYGTIENLPKLDGKRMSSTIRPPKTNN